MAVNLAVQDDAARTIPASYSSIIKALFCRKKIKISVRHTSVTTINNIIALFKKIAFNTHIFKFIKAVP